MYVYIYIYIYIYYIYVYIYILVKHVVSFAIADTISPLIKNIR